MKSKDKLILVALFICNFASAQIIISDIDGNKYRTLTIGKQVWMVENLKTTKYNDGTSIPNITDGGVWARLKTPGYCFFKNDFANKTSYGALYNWYTIKTGKLAPKGWHVATVAEWTTLENYLIANGYNYDGTTSGNKIAKSMAATAGWTNSTNTGAIGNDLTKNNSSGLAGLPGGYRSDDGSFDSIEANGCWWSSTQDSTGSAWLRNLHYGSSDVGRGSGGKRCGFSVRCLRDNV